MALPKLFQKLFQNGGAGTKLREDIMPKDYLPLSGGTMAGDIAFDKTRGRLSSTGAIALKANSGAEMTFCDGNYSNDYYKGAFQIVAMKDAVGRGLEGFPSGLLMWDKKPLPLPTGSVIARAGNYGPYGYLFCNGAAVSRTTYADLFDVIGTIYGEGDGSTTFNLPNLTDRFIQGSDTSGTVKSAGLPNIIGDIRVGWSSVIYPIAGARGAFYSKTFSAYEASYPSGSMQTNSFEAWLDASRSSTVYGASSTVQPPALTMCYYIKY